MTALHPLASGVPHPSPHRHNASPWLVLAGLFAAPAAWSAQLLSSYFLNGDTCRTGAAQSMGAVSPVVAAIGVAAIIVSILALGAAYRTWRQTREEARGDAHDALSAGAGRTRFLGLCGMIGSSIFLTASVFLLLVPFLEAPCAAPFL
jgi:hypothetical protein